MTHIHPTDSELEILHILWSLGPCSVRAVHDVLLIKKSSGYTTTLKLMQIMTEKGLTERDTSSKTHIYKSLVQEQYMKQSLLHRFISSTFNGSASKLVLSALGSQSTSRDELQEIKELIDRIDKSTRNGQSD